jgi:outer membrane protein
MVKETMKIGCLLAGILLMTGTMSWADGPVKIAVMDAKRCIENSEAGKKIYTLLREKVSRSQKDLSARQNELNRLQEEFNKKSEVYSIEVKREKEKELLRKGEDYRDQAREKEAEFQKEELEVFQKLSGELFETAGQIGKEEGYSLILEAKSGVVYFNPAIDITDKVIKRHNEKIKKAK